MSFSHYVTIFFIDVIQPITPTDLYGMFQIKVWTIPFWILRVERVIL